MDSTPPNHPSPYRVGNWTITQLKEELKQRNLSPAGRKQELIDRLERYELDASATPRRRRPRSPTRSPSKVRARSVSKKRPATKSLDQLIEGSPAPLGTTPRRPGRPKKNLQQEWIHTPLKLPQTPPRQSPAPKSTRSTPRTRTPLKRSTTSISTNVFKQHSVSIIAVLAVSFLVSLPFLIPGLDLFRQIILWYGQLLVSGILSVVGLGSSSNSWTSNVNPQLIQTTLLSYSCGTINFYPWKLVCPKEPFPRGTINFVTIFFKCFPDILAWGVGNGLGELLIFAVATAFIRALKLAVSQSRESKISASILGVLIRAKSSFGPSEAFIFASIPNRVLDSAGLLFGLLEIPFGSAVRSIFVGKALISTSIQALAIIIIFSKDLLAQLLGLLQSIAPSMETLIATELDTRRAHLQNPILESAMSLRGVLKLVNLAVVVFLIVHTSVTCLKFRKLPFQK